MRLGKALKSERDAEGSTPFRDLELGQVAVENVVDDRADAFPSLESEQINAQMNVIGDAVFSRGDLTGGWHPFAALAWRLCL